MHAYRSFQSPRGDPSHGPPRLIQACQDLRTSEPDLISDECSSTCMYMHVTLANRIKTIHQENHLSRASMWTGTLTDISDFARVFTRSRQMHAYMYKALSTEQPNNIALAILTFFWQDVYLFALLYE